MIDMHNGFSEADIRVLRAHGIALFAGRVIFDAQPPMDEDAIAAVQAHCAGPLPPALLALWRHTAGGRLDYDLSLEVATSEGPRIEAVSWSQLFYDGSSFYRDLQGWIEYEEQQAWEAAEAAGENPGDSWSGKLRCLPIGGFEYCDRIYAMTSPGASDDGGMLAWKMGLPPAWTPALTEDTVATFAPNLPAAFARLALHDDPLAPSDEYGHGSELLAYLDDCRANGLPAPLADALLAFYLRACIDWRGLLEAGTLAAHPYALRVALCHAVEQDDAALLRRIHASGARMDDLVAGGDNALQHARFLNKSSAVAALERLI